MDGAQVIPVAYCDAPGGLERIADPETGLAIWRRSLPAAFTDWIDRVPFSLLPSLRILVRPADVPAALAKLLDDCGMPSGEMRDLLIDDIHVIAGLFSDITEEELVDIRLERIRHDACWKFHRDNVSVRLLTTYRGPGTEWVRPEWAETAIDDQREYSGPVETLDRHDVAIFKGSNGKGVETGTGYGVVHRSPPVSKLGETRLLLCLNTPSDISPEAWTGS
ncbi:DUF1826 domain-containing protein [Hwanghaeella grinnelliae]|nr:DUF1826 domain-containing protein [Hwanghaeella grinnelliae]